MAYKSKEKYLTYFIKNANIIIAIANNKLCIMYKIRLGNAVPSLMPFSPRYHLQLSKV